MRGSKAVASLVPFQEAQGLDEDALLRQLAAQEVLVLPERQGPEERFTGYRVPARGKPASGMVLEGCSRIGGDPLRRHERAGQGQTKLYIEEMTGSAAMAARARSARMAASALAYAELYATFARRLRESLLTEEEHDDLAERFERDWQGVIVLALRPAPVAQVPLHVRPLARSLGSACALRSTPSPASAEPSCRHATASPWYTPCPRGGAKGLLPRLRATHSARRTARTTEKETR